MLGRTVLGTDDDEETGKLKVLIVKNMEDIACVALKKKKVKSREKLKYKYTWQILHTFIYRHIYIYIITLRSIK